MWSFWASSGVAREASVVESTCLPRSRCRRFWTPVPGGGRGGSTRVSWGPPWGGGMWRGGGREGAQVHDVLQHVHAAESVQLVRAAVPAARRDDLRLPDEDGAWLRPSGVCVGWRGSTGGRAAVSRRSRPLVVPRSDSRARPFSRCCRRCATSGTTSC